MLAKDSFKEALSFSSFADLDDIKNLQRVNINVINRDVRMFADNTSFELEAYMNCCSFLRDTFGCPQYYIGVMMFFLLFNQDALKSEEKDQMKNNVKIIKIYQQAKDLLMQICRDESLSQEVSNQVVNICVVLP